MVDIGNKIRNLRVKNNLTQIEFADKLYISDKTVSSWESNRTLPDINMLLEICKTLNTNIFVFLNEDNINNFEIELKIKSSPIEQKRILESIKNDSIFLKEEDQEATYYKLPHRCMDKEWLRIRRENNNYILNYKKKTDTDIVEEYEVSIDNIDNLKIIFNSIDLSESIYVNKHRISYLYKNKYEVSFDNVENLGDYIEIELKKYENDNDTEIKNLFKLLEELSISINSIELRRYPELMEEVNNEK